jgi:hypothetical protein
MKLTSSGLMESWAKAFVDKSHLKLQKDEEPKSLDFEKLAGTYKLLFYGLVLSSIVFFLEIIASKIKILDRLMKNL